MDKEKDTILGACNHFAVFSLALVYILLNLLSRRHSVGAGVCGNEDGCRSRAELKTVDDVFALKERIEEGGTVAVTAAEALEKDCGERLDVIEFAVVGVGG